ncbi:MAG: hypothetical protein FWC23_04415 [Chitinispirillia bacterium]|nr:hypothetical protein [Chitinispirillia bacterium]MCL2268410.1 hypothetical protein [Chitinispirillia bacterium]
MELSPKIARRRSGRKSGAAVIPALVCLALLAAIAGCGYRVSYNVRVIYADPLFSARALTNVDIAVLPFLTVNGPFSEGPLETGVMLKGLKSQRPDLRFVSHEKFEEVFPPRFNRRWIADFYGGLFRQEVLTVKNMDSLWVHVEQPYLLVYSLRDGAEIINVDQSFFKHVTVICEIWSRDGREVVWRASYKGVSDDSRMTDGELLSESVKALVRNIPPTAPEYGRENW